jgi:uncharacterized protein YlaI
VYFKIDTAIIIARRLKTVAEYMPGVGARCVLCGEWGNDLEYGVKRLKSGAVRRYFVCSTCGFRFPADETSRKVTG